MWQPLVAVNSNNHFTSLPSGTWNYEDAKRQLLWEKYGTTENVTVTPEEVQTFIDQKKGKPKANALLQLAGRCKKRALPGCNCASLLVPLESSSHFGMTMCRRGLV